MSAVQQWNQYEWAFFCRIYGSSCHEIRSNFIASHPHNNQKTPQFCIYFEWKWGICVPWSILCAAKPISLHTNIFYSVALHRHKQPIPNFRFGIAHMKHFVKCNRNSENILLKKDSSIRRTTRSPFEVFVVHSHHPIIQAIAITALHTQKRKGECFWGAVDNIGFIFLVFQR